MGYMHIMWNQLHPSAVGTSYHPHGHNKPGIRIQKILPQTGHIEGRASWGASFLRFLAVRLSSRSGLNVALAVVSLLILYNFMSTEIFTFPIKATSSSSESHSSPSSPSVNNLGPPPFSGPPQKRCFIGVAASAEQIVTIGKGAERTWVRQLTPYCDVRFFVGNRQWKEKLDFEDMIVRLDENDEYPPRNKIFAMWRWMYENHGGEYMWYSKVDLDSYVNKDNWLTMLDNLGTTDLMKYVGSPGFGRPADRESLGLSKPYCMGIGYTMGWSVLQKLAPMLDECLTDAKTTHSDTEVGRCVDRAAGLECTRSDPFIQNVYGFQEGDTYYGYGQHISENGQIMMEFPTKPPTYLFHAAVLHPFKKAQFFDPFHEKVIHYLRPPLRRVAKCEGTTEEVCESAKRVVDNSCTNNPSIQKQVMGKGSPECPPPPVDVVPAIDTLHTFVLSRSDDLEAEKTYSHMKRAFVGGGLSSLHMHKFWRTNEFEMHDRPSTLTPAVRAHRDSMRRLIKRAIEERLPRILVLEEGARPHTDFKNLFRQVMNDDRCGRSIWTENQGGVLLLGAYVDNASSGTLGGWELADSDMEHVAKSRKGASTMCFNYNQQVSGTYAVIFHQATFQPILDWLAAEDSKPFHEVLEVLSLRGHSVRVAYPNLVIQVSDDKSVSANMAEQNRWSLDQYRRVKDISKRGSPSREKAVGRSLTPPLEKSNTDGESSKAITPEHSVNNKDAGASANDGNSPPS